MDGWHVYPDRTEQSVAVDAKSSDPGDTSRSSRTRTRSEGRGSRKVMHLLGRVRHERLCRHTRLHQRDSHMPHSAEVVIVNSWYNFARTPRVVFISRRCLKQHEVQDVRWWIPVLDLRHRRLDDGRHGTRQTDVRHRLKRVPVNKHNTTSIKSPIRENKNKNKLTRDSRADP